MGIQKTALALVVGSMLLGTGYGCTTVKKTTHDTETLVTGDVKKIYPKTFDVVVDAVKDTAKDLEVVQVSEEANGLTKDAKKRYTLTTRTKEDKKLIFVVVREDDTRTSVLLDTAAFSGNSFRQRVVATLEAKLKG